MKIQYCLRLTVLCFMLFGCSFPGSETPTTEETSTVTATSQKIITSSLPTDTPEPVVATNTPVEDTPVTIQTPEATIAPTSVAVPRIWYIPQPGTPLPTYNTVHEAAGCNWLGVGGQIFGSDSAPVSGLTVLAGGTLDGYQVGGLATTGMETNLGEGGYEITLSDHPVDSSGTLWIQVVDENNNPLSSKIYFDTYKDCDLNFVLANFILSQPVIPQGGGWTSYLPVIMNQISLFSNPDSR